MNGDLFRQAKSARFFLGATVALGLLVAAATIAQMVFLSKAVDKVFMVKTENELNARCRRITRTSWVATAVLTVLGTAATFWVRPGMLESFNARPYGYVLSLIALAGLVGIGYFNFKEQDRAALLSSSAYIVGMLTGNVFAIYPNVLPAVNPDNSLTIYNAASSQYSQAVGLVWWSIGMLLAAIYFVLIYRLFRGKVRLEDEGY